MAGNKQRLEGRSAFRGKDSQEAPLIPNLQLHRKSFFPGVVVKMAELFGQGFSGGKSEVTFP